MKGPGMSISRKSRYEDLNLRPNGRLNGIRQVTPVQTRLSLEFNGGRAEI